jgi:hypothetical protein
MLPKITQPIFEITLPSNGKKISCRPYLSKEERLLRYAQESGTEEDITAAVKQVVRNCVLDKDVVIERLPSFDVDWIFIKIKAAASGEKAEVEFVCNNGPEGKPCNQTFKVVIDTKEAKTVFPDLDITKEVPLTDNVSVKLKWPSFDLLITAAQEKTDDAKKLALIAASIEYIAEKGAEKAITLAEVKQDEFNAWIDSLSVAQFEIFEDFVDNLPHFTITKQQKCPKCGFEHSFTFNELASFF